MAKYRPLMGTPNDSSLFQPGPGDRGDMAQGMNARPDNIIRFSLNGGINRALAPNMIAEGELRQAENFWYPRETQTPTVRPGIKQFTDAAAAGAITAVHVYQRDANTSFIVYAAYDSFTSPTTQTLHYINADGDVVDFLETDGTTPAEVGGDDPLIPPSFLTYNGKLLVAAAGEYLRVWDGSEEGEATPACATASILIDYGRTPDPVQGEMIGVGNRTYTLYPTVLQPGEVAIGPAANLLSNDEIADNLIAAINKDSWDWIASKGATAEVVLTSRIPGDGPNSVVFTATVANPNSIDITQPDGGQPGPILGVVDSYGPADGKGPKGGTLVSDKNGRVIVAGDPSFPDRIFFSAPGNEFSFAPEPEGFGQYWDVGTAEGNYLTAVVPFMDEIWAHKAGQNREIYRMKVADPNPDTWLLLTRPYPATHAAINPRCAVSAADKHFVLDRNFAGSYQGTDTFDEVRSAQDGNRVYDLIEDAIVADEAFIVTDPANFALLVFPYAGDYCLVYHYASKRWMSWRFATGVYHCGTFYEAGNCLLLGAADGYIYQTDPTICTDNGVPFSSLLQTRTMGGEDMTDHVVKQTLVDYYSIMQGTGYLEIIANRDEENPQRVYDFAFTDRGTPIDLFHPTLAIDLLDYPYSEVRYGRANSDQEANGEMFAPRVKIIRGAATIHSIMLRLAPHGRAGE